MNSGAREAELVDRVLGGDTSALAELFTMYRPRLWKLVNFRLHPRLRGRVDPDDVLQDAWMRAVDRIDRFLTDASQSPFIWFRFMVNQTLLDLQRRHFGAKKRTLLREFSVSGHWNSSSTSSCLAFQLYSQMPSPSSAVQRAELSRQVDALIEGMDENDREVLALRHFEQLTNRETALVLGLSEQAASVRYIRALKRLKKIVDFVPGMTDEK